MASDIKCILSMLESRIQVASIEQVSLGCDKSLFITYIIIIMYVRILYTYIYVYVLQENGYH